MKALTLFLLCFGSVALADDFKAIDGKEYKNVTVSRVEPDGIVLKTKSGISKVYFVELPKEVQERFHYDAANAAAYSAEQIAAQQAFQSQQAELRRKLAEERNQYWTGQDPAKNQQGKLPPAPAGAVTSRGQPLEVISHGTQVDINRHLALGSVTVVDFYADWCGPCRQLSPTLEQMARTDPEIALRKIDIVDWNTAVARQFNIRTIPQVNIYNRGGRLVGTVVGADVEEVKLYVAQAKTNG
jgi:thiol-disulfide isomerase/thioredoxin